ncbi:mitochondrial import receptor subunit TOM22 homolog [Maniola hyperantus]|uniref:mitochondrial import receptor subunit TOM22 homolog n=1 Tax=Aphantopus hyperantus TaxID=2795564 RepID=UPI00156858DB|nr:mitochondrial import receptor subunit TOM22 homolog [Maniola hyperantus]XP_034831736.1 mitochondrial import receptor subunit TOM22 homolog [Maniola hyperantus]
MFMELPDENELSDSGMESLTASKDDTPERRPEDMFITPVVGTSPSAGTPPYLALKEFDDEPDETLSERLWGLMEMFPECVRNGTYTVTTKTWGGVKGFYQLSRTVMWIVASSSVILFAPVIFEVERAQVEEMQKSQQKQVLLGTNTAMSGPTPGLPPMPR